VPGLRQLISAALAVAVPVALPGSAEAAACARADAIPTRVSRVAVERASLCQINAERRAHGLTPVRLHRQLTLAARMHSLDMVRRRYFSHTAPSGGTFVSRIRRTGYLATPRRWLVGETLAYGWGLGATPAEIVRAWMRSPTHRRIVLRPDYRVVGIGVVRGAPRDKRLPQATFTADFGVIR
jgi:uncharacterized protein YkwD